MTKYRCKHAVEAMRWDGTNQAAFATWYEGLLGAGKKPWFTMFSEISVLCGDDFHMLKLGEWLVWSSGEFLVMDDEQFRETYEEVG